MALLQQITIFNLFFGNVIKLGRYFSYSAVDTRLADSTKKKRNVYAMFFALYTTEEHFKWIPELWFLHH